VTAELGMLRSSTTIEAWSMPREQRLDPIPPGEILMEEFMKPLGISRNALSRDLDMPVSRVSEIVKGARAITADTALRLGAYFGTSAEMWMNLQSAYDLRKARATAWPEIEARIRVRRAA
jgi:addiction module HigA family antidote